MGPLEGFNFKLKYWYHPKGKVKEFFTFLLFVYVRIKSSKDAWKQHKRIAENRMRPEFDDAYKLIVDVTNMLLKGLK